jgi:hypothetical protein
MKKIICTVILTFGLPLAVFVIGCSQPDNPKMAEAPPPSADVKQDTTVPKAAGKSGQEYGASPKYQKAMERLDR